MDQLVKVYPDSSVPSTPQVDSIVLSAAPGSHVDFQLMLQASSTAPAQVMAPASSELFEVIMVNVTAPTGSRGRVGPTPDVLVNVSTSWQGSVGPEMTALWVSLMPQADATSFPLEVCSRITSI